MARSDTVWLTLRAGLRDLLLQEHHRPYNVFSRLHDPANQTPQMITLIGQRTKTLAMRKLRFGSRAPDGINGEVHLSVDENSFRNESPIIFADCELHNASSMIQVGCERVPGDITRRPLQWHRRVSQPLDQAALAHLLYSKLIAPFSNVICLFAEDLGGLSAVAHVLAVWLLGFSNLPSDLPLATRPQIIVLTRWEDHNSFDEVLLTKNLMGSLRGEVQKQNGMMLDIGRSKMKTADIDRLLAAQLGGLTVAALPALDSSSRSWKSLRAQILQCSHDLQIARKASHVAFSSQHLKAFFHLACDHFCSDIVSRFSFVQASRVYDPIPVEFLSHATAFLKCVHPGQISNFAVPVIASAMVFESYPVQMHSFHPLLVFKQFFQRMCIRLDPFINCDQQITSSQLSNAIEVAFCQYAFKLINSKVDRATMHCNVLRRFKEVWKGLHSNTTCLACLTGSPENTLDCHHAVCEPCTADYGTVCREEPDKYWIEACPLCEEPNYRKFHLKPKTAGIRALISEGGGIKGIVPLTFLKQLERTINLPMSISEHFDIAYGSSTGAIIILGIFSNKWSVDYCLQQFRQLSKLAFRKRALFRLPFVTGITSQVLEALFSFIADSRYPSDGITNALKTAFGDESLLFESDGGGTKIGIVATTTDTSSTCLFTNYNGPQNRAQDCVQFSLLLAYEPKLSRYLDRLQHYSPHGRGPGADYMASSPRQHSRATPFQGYHDGGLGGHNNPINLALWEQNTIWSRQNKQPDIVLSLGTGFKRAINSEDDDEKRPSFFRARCVPRLFRSFLNFFVGEKRWQELQNSLQPQIRDRYHRMNIEFCGDEPELDNINALSSLEQQAKSRALSCDDLSNCADNLLAALFYLKLSAIPTFDRTLFICKGQIECRLEPAHRALLRLALRLKDRKANFYLDFEQMVPCITDEIVRSIEAGLPFSCPITFKVMSLDDFVDIKIDGITRRARSISNCPYQIRTIVRDQDLDCVFGSRKGRKRPQEETAERRKRVRFND